MNDTIFRDATFQFLTRVWVCLVFFFEAPLHILSIVFSSLWRILLEIYMLFTPPSVQVYCCESGIFEYYLCNHIPEVSTNLKIFFFQIEAFFWGNASPKWKLQISIEETKSRHMVQSYLSLTTTPDKFCTNFKMIFLYKCYYDINTSIHLCTHPNKIEIILRLHSLCNVTNASLHAIVCAFSGRICLRGPSRRVLLSTRIRESTRVMIHVTFDSWELKLIHIENLQASFWEPLLVKRMASFWSYRHLKLLFLMINQ